MALYRSFFPDSSITPKLHFLEDHVIKWVRKYNTGFGLLGKQERDLSIVGILKDNFDKDISESVTRGTGH